MLKTLCRLAVASGCIMSAAMPASAHFQLVYTPEVNATKAGDQPVKLIFWHPFENGPVMDMGAPLDFYAVHRGDKIDLKSTLSPITFRGATNEARAYDAILPLKRSGDYVMVVVPAPYYEESEDIYIQQITKSYVNRNEIPTDWMEPQGLKTEILPLNRPTNIIAGSTFSGRVLSEGKPAAGIEIEIEYMAAEPDMARNSAKEPTASPMPGGTVVAISDENGYFTFGVPKAGFWGFAALGSGPEKQFQGKELSQDAVLWVRAYDMK
jgi:cobalt/nickel transport protein